MIEKEEGGDFQSLSRIQRWFEINCDGDWENNYGVLIDTVGNPGWSVEIDLSSTILERVEFTEIKENYEDETSWLFVKKADNVLFGSGGTPTLDRILEIMSDWVTENASLSEAKTAGSSEPLSIIQAWYEANCDGEWEREYGVEIKTLDSPGWKVEVDLAWTKLEDLEFKMIRENDEQESSWLVVEKEGDKLVGSCGIHALDRLLALMSDWILSCWLALPDDDSE